MLKQRNDENEHRYVLLSFPENIAFGMRGSDVFTIINILKKKLKKSEELAFSDFGTSFRKVIRKSMQSV